MRPRNPPASDRRSRNTTVQPPFMRGGRERTSRSARLTESFFCGNGARHRHRRQCGDLLRAGSARFLRLPWPSHSGSRKHIVRPSGRNRPGSALWLTVSAIPRLPSRPRCAGRPEPGFSPGLQQLFRKRFRVNTELGIGRHCWTDDRARFLPAAPLKTPRNTTLRQIGVIGRQARRRRPTARVAAFRFERIVWRAGRRTPGSRCATFLFLQPLDDVGPAQNRGRRAPTSSWPLACGGCTSVGSRKIPARRISKTMAGIP